MTQSGGVVVWLVEGTGRMVLQGWYVVPHTTHHTHYIAGLPVPGSLNINSTTLQQYPWLLLVPHVCTTAATCVLSCIYFIYI